MAKKQLEEGPLVAALKSHLARNCFSYHFPAHKGGRGWPDSWRQLIGEQIGRLDLTELPGLDDLHHPSGPIQAAQTRIAALCGAAQSYFLVNGASVGLEAALLGLCQPGDLVVLPRMGHRSLVTAAVISGIRPVFLRGEVDSSWGLPLGVSARELERTLSTFPEVAVVVLVYPSYEGVAFDLQTLVSAAHNRGLPVVVDEAHGAHFGFHPGFPPPALVQGADVVIDGWHKTLGSLTQTAVLHVQDGVRNGERIASALDLLQSTSPSYPLMASLDAAGTEVSVRGSELWEGSLIAVDKVHRHLAQTAFFSVWKPKPPWVQDPLRMVIAAPGLGIDGAHLAGALAEQGHLSVEAWGERHVLLVFSLADDSGSDLRVTRAFDTVAQELQPYAVDRRGEGPVRPWPTDLPEMALTPREAFFAPRRALPLVRAVGQVAAQAVIPYPPGIPLCWPGEVIDEDLVAWVEEWSLRGGGLQGLTKEREVAVVG